MKEFKSKVGYEILIPVLVILTGTIIWPVIDGAPMKTIITIIAIILPVTLFILHMFFRTTYSINEKNELLIKCGFLFNSKVDISKIKSVSKTRNLISSPAPSLDRIALKYGKWDSAIISPKDKTRFIEELLKINPSIENKLK
ncbi:MAG: hypothetical protein ACJA08_001389 [Cyclobacteriaceae bacterium]|jgi:hypothetical protein